MCKRIYSGFSLSPEVKETIKESLEDEYNINLGEFDEYLKETKFSSIINSAYQRHLKSFAEDFKEVIKIEENYEKDDYGSVIEQFKKYKIL